MHRLENKHDPPPALGQVVVMAFAEDRKHITTLDELDTILIIKPNQETPYFKFPGGMMYREGETFEAAAVRELREETGVIASPCRRNLFELCRVPKLRHRPHTSQFDVAFFAAFGCDFSRLKDPLFRDVGDEKEESMRTRFADVHRPGQTWPIPTQLSRQARMFPFHLELLGKAAQRFRPA